MSNRKPRTLEWPALLLASGLGCLAVCGCGPRASILSPPDLSAAAADGQVAVSVDLGSAVTAPGTVSARLLRGVDFPPADVLPLGERLVVSGATASASLGPGRPLAGTQHALREHRP